MTNDTTGLYDMFDDHTGAEDPIALFDEFNTLQVGECTTNPPADIWKCIENIPTQWSKVAFAYYVNEVPWTDTGLNVIARIENGEVVERLSFTLIE